MKALSLGMPLLVLDLLVGMLFFVLILVTVQPQPRPAEPPEAETRRLRAENTELSARLLAQEGNVQGRDAPSAGRDGGKPLPPSAAAEASSLTLLRAEVADLTARNETLRRALEAREAGKTAPVDRKGDASHTDVQPDGKTVEKGENKESLLAGREARIKQLQTEVFRLFTLVEESSREAGEARQARVTLEAQLKQREARLTELNQEIESLSARTPGLVQSQAYFNQPATPPEPATAPSPEITTLLPKPGGAPSTDSSRPPARRFDRTAPRPPAMNQP
ncbi:hypothetical protein SIID45300_00131 [Candidatus Magnetaquicoccaceae bacterium FCR-1]|uniref:Uncharacterized protein n=1 Tax=Candidatus Magnetaquiglobus chichijimensis TaxID=3141448 RepID=A0ABQ0C4M0_9PROT